MGGYLLLIYLDVGYLLLIYLDVGYLLLIYLVVIVVVVVGYLLLIYLVVIVIVVGYLLLVVIHKRIKIRSKKNQITQIAQIAPKMKSKTRKQVQLLPKH